jgi:hypothetical protein
LTEWLAVAVVEQKAPGLNATSVFGSRIEEDARRCDRALAAEGRTALADL